MACVTKAKTTKRSFQTHNTLKTIASNESNISRQKKLLVLDLDETLVHSRHTTYGDDEVDFSFSFSEQESVYYVKRRPHLQKFLERMAELFDVAVFTASVKDYADYILNFLDPEGKYIMRRVYYDPDDDAGEYVKDLSIFGVELSNVIIIDNCPHNYRKQPHNGIPITSWFVDPNDDELCTLIPFLEELSVATDVRHLISKRFGDKNGKGAGKKNDTPEVLSKQLGMKKERENQKVDEKQMGNKNKKESKKVDAAKKQVRKNKK